MFAELGMSPSPDGGAAGQWWAAYGRVRIRVRPQWTLLEARLPLHLGDIQALFSAPGSVCDCRRQSRTMDQVQRVTRAEETQVPSDGQSYKPLRDHSLQHQPLEITSRLQLCCSSPRPREAADQME